MKQRCYNRNNQHYQWYSGKGITICNELLGDNGLQNFFEWSLSHGYNENLTINRIDSSKGYSSDNCQWITSSSNSSKTHIGISEDTICKTVLEQIKTLCVKLNISVSELTRLCNTSPQAFSQKMKREGFTPADLKKVAEAAGCKYYSTERQQGNRLIQLNMKHKPSKTRLYSIYSNMVIIWFQ